jgi:hypothetical protein
MKKLLILAGFCFCATFTHAQLLKSDGSFINAAGVLGYCKTDGTVENPSHTTVGYILTDGSGIVQNSSHGVIGYVKTDGTMQNSHHVAMGYFVTGYLQDAAHKPLAQLRTQQEATLKLYFFP